jgi:hypothetical protein
MQGYGFINIIFCLFVVVNLASFLSVMVFGASLGLSSLLPLPPLLPFFLFLLRQALAM